MLDKIEPPHIEQMAQKVAGAATVTIPGGSVLFGLSLDEWNLFLGLLFPSLTMCIYFYFKRREDKRDEKFKKELLKRAKLEV